MENPFEENQNVRPVFLTVLCILTFISCGWGILSNLFTLISAGLTDAATQMDQYSEMMDQMGGDGNSSFLAGIMSSSGELLQATLQYSTPIAASKLALELISLVGAIMMFQLKRIGFYFYAASQILMLFVLPVIIGFSMLVMTGIMFNSMFVILFIILYAINLKHMH